MATVSLPGQMEITMKEILNLEKEMDMERESMQMDLNIKENIQMINPMEEVKINQVY